MGAVPAGNGVSLGEGTNDGHLGLALQEAAGNPFVSTGSRTLAVEGAKKTRSSSFSQELAVPGIQASDQFLWPLEDSGEVSGR